MRRVLQVAVATALALLPAVLAQAQADIATEPNQQSELPPLEIAARRVEFLAGTQFIAKPRAYYMDRDRDKNQDNVGFALGGAVQYLSGWAFDRLQLRATGYSSQDLYGPSDKDGTQLFLPGPRCQRLRGSQTATTA